MKLVVMKFGGTSVEDGAAIGRTAAIVAERIANGKSPVVVVSAMAKVTDQLLRAAAAAAQKQPADHRQIVVEGDQLLAAGALRTRRHYRHAQGQAVDTHVQKAAKCQPEGENRRCN